MSFLKDLWCCVWTSPPADRVLSLSPDLGLQSRCTVVKWLCSVSLPAHEVHAMNTY